MGPSRGGRHLVGYTRPGGLSPARGGRKSGPGGPVERRANPRRTNNRPLPKRSCERFEVREERWKVRLTIPMALLESARPATNSRCRKSSASTPADRDEVTTNVAGNVIACRNRGPRSRAVAGHRDQNRDAGDPHRRQRVSVLPDDRRRDPQQLVGQRMTVWTREGPVCAVIARKPVHLLNDQERKQVVKLESCSWTSAPRTRPTRPRWSSSATGDVSRAAARSQRADHRARPGQQGGAGVALERSAASPTSGSRPPLRGLDRAGGDWPPRRGPRYRIDPRVGIAVDVTHATGCPTMDPRQQGDIKLGQGP